jgi:hypothetical protein
MSALELSSNHQGTSFQQSIMEELAPFVDEDPVLKIVAARKFNVVEWLVPGVGALAQREEALREVDVQHFQAAFASHDEVMKLVLDIVRVQETWSSQQPALHHHVSLSPLPSESPSRFGAAIHRSQHDFTAAICNIFACESNETPLVHGEAIALNTNDSSDGGKRMRTQA